MFQNGQNKRTDQDKGWRVVHQISAQLAEFIIITRFSHLKYFLFLEHFLSLESDRKFKILCSKSYQLQSLVRRIFLV